MDQPSSAARAAGLRYVNDDEPGISRLRRGGGFSYEAADGTPIRDDETLRRIRSLAIPPAWDDVWICSSPRGHIQATGRDARGRKQYRYHPQWRAVRDQSKYARTIAFARALPQLRRRVARDLRRPGFQRQKMVAVVVRLLETTLLRVGNEEYARQNRSFGLTTLRNRHIEIDGSEVRFRFRAKSGKQADVGVRDRRLARVLRELQELPGQRVFQYVDDDGELQPIDSDDVNAYLRDAMGDDFSAKDFRTWAATVLMASTLCAADKRRDDDDDAKAGPTKRRLNRAIEAVAHSLGNTAAVCRSSYIHPDVMDSYLDGSLDRAAQRAAARAAARGEVHGLKDDERLVLNLLRRRLARETSRQAAA